jgi:uncharacterized membrane protein HdeD (DUF308 family)
MMAGIEIRAVGLPMRRAWLWLVLLGLALTALGLVAVIHPLTASVVTLAWIGGLFALAGLVQLLQMWTARGWRGGFWHIANGAAYLLGGLVLLFNPLAGAVAVSLIIAAILIGTGTLRLIGGIIMRPEAGWLWIALGGAVGAAAGTALALLPPGQSALIPGMLVGAALMAEGLILLALAIAARRAARLG